MFDDFVGKTIEEAASTYKECLDYIDYYEGFSKYLEFDNVENLCAKVNTLLNIVFCKELPSDGSWELLLETILGSKLYSMPQSCDLVLMAYCLIKNYRDTLTSEPFEFFDLAAENESLALVSGSIMFINMIFMADRDIEEDPYPLKDRMDDIEDTMCLLTKWWNINVLPE